MNNVQRRRTLTLSKYGLNKEQLSDLYGKENFSIAQIAKKINAPSSTVQSWLIRLNIPRRSREKSWAPNGSEDLGYILGALLADGDFYQHNGRYHIRLRVKDYDFALAFKCSLEKVLNTSLKIGRDAGLFRVTTSRKRLFQWRKSLTDDNLRKILLQNKAMAKGFIRGFFDGDGWTTTDKSRSFNRYVRAQNNNGKLLEICRSLLNDHFGIYSIFYHETDNGHGFYPNGTAQKPSSYFILAINRQTDVKHYYEQIGFSIRRKNIGVMENGDNRRSP